MKSKFLTLAVVASVAALTSAASAQIVNGSFETPASSSDQITTAATDTIISGWTINSPPGSAYTGTAAYGGGSGYDGITNGTGNQGALLNPIFGYYYSYLISNATVATVTANTPYTLSANVGIPAGDFAAPNNPNQGDDILTIELVESGGTVFASQSFDTSLFSVGTLTPLTLSYVSGAAPSDLGQGLQAEFFLQNGGNDNHSPIVIDNVTLSTGAVPEPSAYAMMFLGAGALAFLARRKLANS